MEIEITEDLTTGISWIDDQHKNLFTKANNYITAVNQNRGHKEIQTAIHLLEEYANTHFSTEEKYMKLYEEQQNEKKYSEASYDKLYSKMTVKIIY